MATPTLKLIRTFETCKRRGATGRRGKLTVGGTSTVYHTVERADGYVYLRPGTYDCRTGKRSSNGKPCIHITHSQRNNKGKIAEIVVHVANYPDEVMGCIAPGMTKSTQGVGSSKMALTAIFEAIGASDKQLGHKADKSVACTLLVSGHV